MTDFKSIRDEIFSVRKAFGFTEEQAIDWIRSFFNQYDSEFQCDFNRYVTGDALANQYGVIYA